MRFGWNVELFYSKWSLVDPDVILLNHFIQYMLWIFFIYLLMIVYHFLSNSSFKKWFSFISSITFIFGSLSNWWELIFSWSKVRFFNLSSLCFKVFVFLSGMFSALTRKIFWGVMMLLFVVLNILMQQVVWLGLFFLLALHATQTHAHMTQVP